MWTIHNMGHHCWKHQTIRNDLNLMFTLVLPEVVWCSIDIRPYINCTQNQIKYHMHQNLHNQFDYVTVFLHPLLQWVIATPNTASKDWRSVTKFVFEAFKTFWNKIVVACNFNLCFSTNLNISRRSCGHCTIYDFHNSTDFFWQILSCAYALCFRRVL